MGQNSSWTRIGTQSESTSNSRFRLVRFNSVQGQWEDEDSSCYPHHQEGLKHIFIQPENPTQTILVTDNQIAKLDEDIVKTEPTVEENTTQSEPQLQNTGLGTSHEDEASAATLAEDRKQHEPSEFSRISSRNRNQPDRFGEPIPKILLKKEEGCDGFKETSWNFEVSFFKVWTNKKIAHDLCCYVD